MIKNIYYICGILAFLFFINYSYFVDKLNNDTGKNALLPVFSTGFIKGEIRYENIIPIEDLQNKSGKIVINIDNNSVARYKRIYDGRLFSGEFLLNFKIKEFSDGENEEIQLIFGPTDFEYQKEKSTLYNDVFYAVLKLTEDGRTSFRGFAGNDYKIIEELR